MKVIHNTLALLILLLTVSLLTGCEEKQKSTENALPVENTTQLVSVTKPAPEKQIEKRQEELALQKPIEKIEEQPIPSPKEPEPEPKIVQESADISSFVLTGVKGKQLNGTIGKEKLLIETESKPLILINLFDMNDADSIAQVSYLATLQTKHEKRLGVIGIPTNSGVDTQELRKWVEENEINYFVATVSGKPLADILMEEHNITQMPATLLYYNGTNKSIYEGAVPVEMITHDIKQTSKK